MQRDPQQDAHEPAPTGMPRCPKCGWNDVRLSHSKGVLDSALEMFAIARFKCRSCGTRFHRVYRPRVEES